MSKLLLSAAFAGTVVLAITQDASARCRNYRWGTPVYRYQYSAPAAPVVAAPAPVAVGTVPPPPAVAQRGTGYAYRSFSYDPGEAPVYPTPPMAGRRLMPAESPFYRADHKLLGTSYVD